MKAIAALVSVMISAAIAGCGSGAAHAPKPAVARPVHFSSAAKFAESVAGRAALPVISGTSGAPVRYRTIEYTAEVSNAGLPGSYTAFVLIVRRMTIEPSSSATIDVFPDGSATFATPVDRERWKAAGSPSLAPAPRGGQVLSLPAGQFSFIPQGTTLTYRQARSLPLTPQALLAQLLKHLRTFVGAHPPANMLLEQLGYLIAAAPLTMAARRAAWRAVAVLPGLRLCGSGADLVHRRGTGLCVDSSGDETEILVSTRTGAVLAVEDRLLRRDRMYPLVSTGSMISSTTFVSP